MKSTHANRLETLETRQLLSSGATLRDVRSYDGSGNNLAHAQWGATGAQLTRVAPAAYADGKSAPAGPNRPSARAISNALAAHEEEEVPNENHLAAYAYAWGQFIDHDLDLTQNASPSEPFNVIVPKGDASFDPASRGGATIALSRSQSAAGTGTTSPRQQTNSITSYIDASMIYGSDATRARALRTGNGGELKTSAGNLLPLNRIGLANANDAHLFPDDQLFAAGDVRANENIELTAVHTLFMREHNRLARQIAASDSHLTDEQIYQRARRIVIAEVQHITYSEFLPALIGGGAIGAYRGYDAKTNVAVSNEFSTAGFRLGHSMLADDVEFMDNDGDDVHDEIPLAEAFFNPPMVKEFGPDPILKYLASSNAEQVDSQVVDGVRNFLFGPPGAGGFDLASLNIQRGRDHGLSDYNSTRAAMGLSRVTRFSQITSNRDVQQALRTTYGSVDNIDLWVGGLAEDHVSGSNLGATFQRIVADQFRRTRDGDRFWYSRTLNDSERSAVEGMTLADVIRANTSIDNLQDNVFVFQVKVQGTVFNDRDGDGQRDVVRMDGRRLFADQGLSGRTVELFDPEAEEVVATTTSGARGRFSFDGVQIGEYVVRLAHADGMANTTQGTTIKVTRGDVAFDDIGLGQRSMNAARPRTASATIKQVRQDLAAHRCSLEDLFMH